MKQMLLAIAAWFESRLQLRETLLPLLVHPVPRGLTDRRGWWYVFGSAAITMLLLQVVTGIFLAMVYVPSTEDAYASLEYLNYHQPLGWFVRALHFWSANAMVFMVLVHMTQVFLYGAYKYPRELTWVVGVVLLVLTLGMGFTGQILRWDADAYWGVGVGASIAGRLPVVGPAAVEALLGGSYIGAPTLSRFFALHVFILPAILFAALAVHLYLVVKRGVSEPPTPGKPVDPATYDKEYEQELKQGVPFFPEPIYRDGVFSAGCVLIVCMLAAVFGPFGPNAQPDPTLIEANPRPEWYFLPIFGMASLCPPQLEDIFLLYVPPVFFLGLVLVPFVAGKGERASSRRPVAVLTVIVLWLAFIVFGWLGHLSPWSPIMDAWSGTPVPVEMIRGLTPLEMQGAVVLQNKNCRNCHAVGNEGGRRGPDLDGVGIRLTRDELITQVIRGSGDMPAYGKQVSPAEVAALVAFLQTLRPAGDPVARPPVVAKP